MTITAVTSLGQFNEIVGSSYHYHLRYPTGLALNRTRLANLLSDLTGKRHHL